MPLPAIATVTESPSASASRRPSEIASNDDRLTWPSRCSAKTRIMGPGESLPAPVVAGARRARKGSDQLLLFAQQPHDLPGGLPRVAGEDPARGAGGRHLKGGPAQRLLT